jgi:hypothetical protein
MQQLKRIVYGNSSAALNWKGKLKTTEFQISIVHDGKNGGL